MQKKHAAVAAVVLGAAIAAAAPGSAAPATRAARAPVNAPRVAESVDPEMTPAHVRASDVALAVEKRDAFGGIRVTPDNTAIEVYVTRRDAALEAAARAAAKDAPLRFTRVRHSHRSLRALQNRVLADHLAGRLPAPVSGVPVKDSLNRVVIEVPDLTPPIATALLARYGRDNVVVHRGGRVAPTAASRIDDFAQWNSGSFIYSPQSGGGCTGGPGVKDSAGNEYLLSAGHCFIDWLDGGVSGWDFAVYQQAPFATTDDDPVRIGTAKARYPAMHDQDMDIALITLWDGGSGLTFVTTSPTATTPTSKPQLGTIRAVEGTWVCFSGAYTGERCSAKVDAFDDPYPTGAGGLATITHVNRAVNVIGNVLSGPGDSGGPVYQKTIDGSGVYVAGIIHGHQLYDQDHLQCPAFKYYDRGETCDSIVLFTGVNSAMAHFGVTLNVR